MALPLTRNSRLVSGATAAARRAAATRPVRDPAGLSTARQTASRARLPSEPVEACSPQTKDVSKSSRTARTAREAARDIAVSKSSPSAHAGAASSTTIVAWLRRVSRYWRTSSWLSPADAVALADDRQWMWRRSSPGTYSRSAWKARSLWDTASVGTPSRSRSSPAPSESSGTIGGRTRISVTPVQVTSRETSDSGSPRRVVAGPTAITPRRSVRTVKDSSWVAPAASSGMP